MNAVIEHKTTDVAETHNAPITPMEMLDRAVTSGASVETLERLMNLQERWEKNQARKAFDQAIAAAKSEIPVIEKNRKGHNGRYADFAAYARVIDPIISKYGLSYRFSTKQADRILVTCILSHEAGHCEENELAGPADTSGNKNAIQAIGSTLTYLQRYTLTQALGLAASDDDDANTADKSTSPLDADQIAKIRTLLDETDSDIAKFCKYMGVESVAEIQASAFKRAVAVLENKKGAGK